MANQPRPPLPPRSLAILLMVVGVIGFAIGLVAYDGQLLCLLGSTLVVFVGFGFILLIRHQSGSPEAVREADQSGAMSQAPAPESWNNQPLPTAQPVSEQPVPNWAGGVQGLTGQVSAVLRNQGAQVRIDARREDRSILQVRSRSGVNYTALILEGHDVVDVNEVRGLFGLMTGSGSIGAFMVTGGAYTPQALDWARRRSLALLVAEQVAEILID